MINYAIKRKTQQKENNYANLGMTLESDLDITNQQYLDSETAVIYKKPTPIQVVNVSYPARNKAKITEAYYKTPSTTDYNGIYRGLYIDFDAKETNSKTSIPLSNFHTHQVRHLTQVKKQKGIAFFIVHFKYYNEYYLLLIDDFLYFWQQKDDDKGRKSIPYHYFKQHVKRISFAFRPRLDYLKVIDEIIESK